MELLEIDISLDDILKEKEEYFSDESDFSMSFSREEIDRELFVAKILNETLIKISV